MKEETVAIISSQTEVIDKHFLITLKVPHSFMDAVPGQFVMVRLKEGEFPFLSRPLSIYSVYASEGETFMEILYRVAGKGTEVFSKLQGGDALKVLGPLGKGFDMTGADHKIVLIAGGIGVAPISFLAQRYRQEYPGREIICYIGSVKAGALLGIERLEMLCSSVEISTDDGSLGYKGLVTELFKKEMARYDKDGTIIYSCGPRPMLKGLQALLNDGPLPCQVSLEERMACGIGACLGCVVRMRSGDGKSSMVRVCTEGPVFDIKCVDFEE